MAEKGKKKTKKKKRWGRLKNWPVQVRKKKLNRKKKKKKEKK